MQHILMSHTNHYNSKASILITHDIANNYTNNHLCLRYKGYRKD